MSEASEPLAECIATGQKLSAEYDSEAHVIPNAIGGRLKPKGVLCRKANSEIGDSIEAPFLKSYQSIMSLIGGKRQRGEHPSFKVEAPDGKIYLYNQDHNLTPARPEYHAEDLPDNGGESIQIVARTMAEARTLLGRVAKKYPDFDVEQAISQASVTSQPSPQMKFSLSVGPNVYFPLAFAAAATLNASRGLPVHPSFKQYVSSLKTVPPVVPKDAFYWEPGGIWPNEVNAGTHMITTIASTRRTKMLTVVRLIGLPGVGIITDYCGVRSRVITYAVDVVRGEDVRIEIDAASIANTNWEPTHTLGDNSLFALHQRRFTEVLALSKRLGYIQ